eukprot:SM000246S08213  [mRNA]  locus=s246:170711:175080:- [translate_table: standard]
MPLVRGADGQLHTRRADLVAIPPGGGPRIIADVVTADCVDSANPSKSATTAGHAVALAARGKERKYADHPPGDEFAALAIDVHGAYGSGWLDLLQRLARQAIGAAAGILPGKNGQTLNPKPKRIGTSFKNRGFSARGTHRAPAAGAAMAVLLVRCTVVAPARRRQAAAATVLPDHFVLVRGKRVEYVGPMRPVVDVTTEVVDLGGRYLLPGLCDAHVHVTAVTADLHAMASMPPSLVTARASKLLRDMLLRGFTTVRDMGGCDWGLAQAVEEDIFVGPRILFSGHALSQTGGHGDLRRKGEEQLPACPCSELFANANTTIGRVCDGVPEVRRAARDELRKGAHQVKVMASGGVASPTDKLTDLQACKDWQLRMTVVLVTFSEEELRAIVEEASNAGTYVAAHAYTAAAVSRALKCGVRSIEHGNLLDAECTQLLVEKDAYLVPTLVTYDQLMKQGQAAGLPQESVQKVGNLLEKGLQALRLAQEVGVAICFGSDLLGSMQSSQLQEFTLRSGCLSASELLTSATQTCAELFGMDGEVGIIQAGAFADMLVVDKNPIEDPTVLLDCTNLLMIWKEGRLVKNMLTDTSETRIQT